MTKEEMKVYADKYRRVQTKLSIGLAIFIFVIAATLIGLSITLIFYANNNGWIWLAIVVMMILGLVDIPLGIKLIKYSKIRFKRMTDKEAAVHYCKIHGFNSKIE